jgi:5'-methylthioadenosine phosphorylase
MRAAEQVEAVTHADGTYVCMEGPQFSTRAESLMHRAWGGDLIGMTAMPEAKLAREAQMCYALVALVSDYDCWREHDAATDKKGLLEEILSNLNRATQNAVMLIEKTLETAPPLCDETCPCRKSLELAVWTHPNAIHSDLRTRLAPLFQ